MKTERSGIVRGTSEPNMALKQEKSGVMRLVRLGESQQTKAIPIHKFMTPTEEDIIVGVIERYGEQLDLLD